MARTGILVSLLLVLCMSSGVLANGPGKKPCKKPVVKAKTCTPPPPVCHPPKPCHPEEPCSPDAPCQSPPPPCQPKKCNKSLWAMISRHPQLTIFTELCKLVGLDSLLNDRHYKATVFAPVDLAFETSCAELGTSLKALKRNKLMLLAYLRYHIVPGVTITKSRVVPNLPPLQTLACPDCLLDASLFWSRFIVQGDLSSARVIQCDLIDCGVVHLVDRLLIPDVKKYSCDTPPPCVQSPPPCKVALPQGCPPPPCTETQCPSTLSYLSSIPDFSYFVRAIYAVPGLSAVLATPTVRFTIFAPTNKALTMYLTAVSQDLNTFLANVNNLSAFVYAHILNFPYSADDLIRGPNVLTTYNNQQYYTSVQMGQVFIKDTNGNSLCPPIALGNSFVCNSIVHVVAFPLAWPGKPLVINLPQPSTVYGPSNSILGGLERVPEASIFVSLCRLSEACLSAMASTTSIDTWFVPTDSAWTPFFAQAGLSIPLLKANMNKLSNILSHHRISGQALPTFIPTNGAVSISVYGRTLQWQQPPSQTPAFSAASPPSVTRILSVGYNTATITNANNIGGRAIYHLCDSVLFQAY